MQYIKDGLLNRLDCWIRWLRKDVSWPFPYRRAKNNQPFDKDAVDLCTPNLGGISVEEKWDAYIDWAKSEFPAQRNVYLLK